MDALRPPTAPAAPTAAAWPRSAQLAVAFLLGVSCALLGVRLFGSAGRPLDLTYVPPLDLNRAELSDLRQLPGIGPTLAERIATARDESGGFRTVDDLRTVPGVGPARLERLKPWVRVDGTIIDDGILPSVSAPKKVDALAEPIDLNRATAAELQMLPGIGPTLAERIIAERAKAPFMSEEELDRVSGIGPKTLEKLRPFVTVQPPIFPDDDG